MSEQKNKLLEVKDLKVSFFTWGLKKPHNRICLLALSRTRFSNNSHNFAIIKVIGDTANGFYLAGRGKEGDFQVFYFQQFIFPRKR